MSKTIIHTDKEPPPRLAHTAKQSAQAMVEVKGSDSL